MGKPFRIFNESEFRAGMNEFVGIYDLSVSRIIGLYEIKCNSWSLSYSSYGLNFKYSLNSSGVIKSFFMLQVVYRFRIQP